jgi:hypothetical protein
MKTIEDLKNDIIEYLKRKLSYSLPLDASVSDVLITAITGVSMDHLKASMPELNKEKVENVETIVGLFESAYQSIHTLVEYQKTLTSVEQKTTFYSDCIAYLDGKKSSQTLPQFIINALNYQEKDKNVTTLDSKNTSSPQSSATQEKSISVDESIKLFVKNQVEEFYSQNQKILQ